MHEAEFAAAVLAVLLGLAMLVIGSVAVMLIVHAWWTLRGKENGYDD